MKKLPFILAIMAVAITAYAFTGTSKQPVTTPTQPRVHAPAQSPTMITMAFVGDIMMHSTQIKSGLNPDTGTYNFDNYFTVLGERFRKYDYLIGNLETPVAGADKKFGQFPVFNAPDEILDALKSTGFDALQIANNHSYDRGYVGMVRTKNEIAKRNMIAVGSSDDSSPYSPTIVDVSGIKIGIVSATYGFSSGKNPSDKPYAVHTLDSNQIIPMITTAKNAGAEIIVVMPHWGTEYQRAASSGQTVLTKSWIDAGANVIVGTHPHVVQPVKTITTDLGNTGIVAYSLGNFVSNQQDMYTDLGGLFELTIEKKNTKTPATVSGYRFEYLYTHKDKTTRPGKTVYSVVPLSDAITIPTLTSDQKTRINRYLALPNPPTGI